MANNRLLNLLQSSGYSCLHYAALWGRIPVVKMLIEHGADLQQRNSHGERAREAAVRYNQEECIDFLDWAGNRFLQLVFLLFLFLILLINTFVCFLLLSIVFRSYSNSIET